MVAAGIFVLCAVSALMSYEPRWSLDGLRSVAFMATCGIVAFWVQSRAQAWCLAWTLLLSAQVGLLYTGYQLLVGSGVRLVELSPDSPLHPYFQPGDVVLRVDGEVVRTPEDITRLVLQKPLPSSQPVSVTGRRIELPLTAPLDRAALQSRLALLGPAGLGIRASAPARDFRASGFFRTTSPMPRCCKFSFPWRSAWPGVPSDAGAGGSGGWRCCFCWRWG